MSKKEQFATQEDIKPLEEAFRTLNREMGEVQGELKWIKLLMGATALATVGELFITAFGG